MGQKLPPAVSAAMIVIVVVIVAFYGYRLVRGPAGSLAGEKPPGMPADVAAEFQKRSGGVTGPPPGAAKGPGISAPGMGGGYPMGPGGAAVPMAPGGR